MPITSHEIIAIKKEYVCDRCTEGVLRLRYNIGIINTNPKQYLHFCTSCNAEFYLTLIYPILEYKERSFMVAEPLRFEAKEAITKTSNK